MSEIFELKSGPNIDHLSPMSESSRTQEWSKYIDNVSLMSESFEHKSGPNIDHMSTSI